MKITLKKEHGQLIPYSNEDYEALQKLSDAVYQVDIKNLDSRTLQQNSALWKWMSMIATHLNNKNMYISNTIKSEVEWNKDSVKALIFNPIMEALYGKKSSTELQKKDFDKIIDTICYVFGKRGVEIPDFPTK